MAKNSQFLLIFGKNCSGLPSSPSFSFVIVIIFARSNHDEQFCRPTGSDALLDRNLNPSLYSTVLFQCLFPNCDPYLVLKTK